MNVQMMIDALNAYKVNNPMLAAEVDVQLKELKDAAVHNNTDWSGNRFDESSPYYSDECCVVPTELVSGYMRDTTLVAYARAYAECDGQPDYDAYVAKCELPPCVTDAMYAIGYKRTASDYERVASSYDDLLQNDDFVYEDVYAPIDDSLDDRFVKVEMLYHAYEAMRHAGYALVIDDEPVAYNAIRITVE